MGFTLSIVLTSLLIFVLAGVACRQPPKAKPNEPVPIAKPTPASEVENEPENEVAIKIKREADCTLEPENEPPGVAKSSGKRIPRAEIEKRLNRLARSTPPKVEQISAMCYSVASPPMETQYICPECGAKTIYTMEKTDDVYEFMQAQDVKRKVAWGVAGCRESVPSIKGLAVQLDESQFCKCCSPDVELPKLGLVITYADGSVHRVWDIDWKDIEVIRAFMAGEKTVGSRLDQRPLKDYINRLEELLGIEMGTPESSSE